MKTTQCLTTQHNLVCVCDTHQTVYCAWILRSHLRCNMTTYSIFFRWLGTCRARRYLIPWTLIISHHTGKGIQNPLQEQGVLLNHWDIFPTPDLFSNRKMSETNLLAVLAVKCRLPCKVLFSNQGEKNFSYSIAL